MDLGLHPDEPLGEGLRRIATAQAETALADLDQRGSQGMPAAVHDLRKRCKATRAVARLARGGIGAAYRPTNDAFRDAARLLSGPRDAQVLVAVLDDLLADAGGDVDASGLREILVHRHEAATDRLARDDGPFEEARALLERGRELVASWELDDDFDAIAPGFERTYARARTDARRCRKRPTTERLHDWRKRVKYHWHHLQVLEPCLPELVGPWAEAVHGLSDVLGDDHDLAILGHTISADPGAHGGEPLVREVCDRIAARRAELRAEAHRLGHRFTAEHPDAVVDRLRLWFDAWREEA